MKYHDSREGVEKDFKGHCVTKLAEQYRGNPLLQEYTDYTLFTFARATILAAWPDISYQGQDGEGFHTLLVKPTPTTNILSCAMCADRNTLSHIGENPTAQTGTLVNGICGAAVSRLTGGRMWQIKPFVMRRPFPIGESAIIKMTLPKPNSAVTRIEMQGSTTGSTEPLFEPTMVYLA